MTTGSKLLRALRARYKHPRDVLTRLGLDASLLNDPELRCRFDPRDHTGGSTVGAAGDDVPIDPMMGNTKSFDSDPPLVHPSPLQNLGGKDDEPDEWGPFRSYLKDCGLTEDEAEEARRIVQDSRRARRGNGKDEFPLNAVKSGDRPAPSRGHFGGPRGANQFADGNERHAMDAAISKRLARRFPGLARIGVEPSVRSSDRITTDARTPSPARLARTMRRFPDAARIGRECDVAHSALDRPAARSRYEV